MLRTKYGIDLIVASSRNLSMFNRYAFFLNVPIVVVSVSAKREPHLR
jgi:hypothetical protein